MRSNNPKQKTEKITIVDFDQEADYRKGKIIEEVEKIYKTDEEWKRLLTPEQLLGHNRAFL